MVTGEFQYKSKWQIEKLDVEDGFVYFDLPAGKLEIVISLDMRVKKYRANQQVAHDFGKVAIQRGPVVYCAESADQTTDVWKYQLPQTGELSCSYDDKLLNGVVVIQADTKVVNESSQVLYQEYQPLNWQTEKLMLIPYYAWANRGDNQMAVWIDQSEC